MATVFTIQKGYWNNWYIVDNSHSKGPILKVIQDNILFRNPAFGKNTNAQSAFESFSNTTVHRRSAFRIVSVDQNADSFYRKIRKRGFWPVPVFPTKTKGFLLT